MIYIAVCDDEDGFLVLEQKLISAYMQKHAYQYCVDTFSSGTDLLKRGSVITNFDIIFLDINMDKLNGIETARKIRESGSDAYIVFVTAFISYAIEGYKVDAVRYLLKESDCLEASLEECLDSIIRRMNYQENRETFAFLEGDMTISPDDIVYIESNLHKLTFHLVKKYKERYTIYEKLDVLEKRLNYYNFCRIHKSFLVNLKYVEEIKRYNVKLTENVCHTSYLSVSQSRYLDAREQFIFYQGEV
ncbi:LytTR family DNA-binding domain-containing protein [Eubacterium sp. MSJ-13]|uniref:LytR/AlgR family response regulator transcription factor n=1 Tax=Eubacterium sp. MSJ-13 TaxID=2841513 RepID=UPI001C0FDD0E|nr:LytTR family DNA-binding domain-containing protein [Eubacterium sp. MSJ-13]MBU5478487.1 LytTR family DNA-binding domain-containing protein [Eubacterium sp. MSJ-13]